ncbi:MAG: hypothetical protein OXG99_15990 [Alphaproteobacteria bacterium]|nr:hypothetical protein [Alphaproteobacteria bacterium]
MREAPVGRHENRPPAPAAPQHAEHADIQPVPQILLPDILRNLPFLLNRAYVVFLARAEGQLPLRREGSDAAQYRFFRRVELHEHELSVHRLAWKVVAVRQHQIGFELQAALPETAKDPGNLLSRE